MHDRVQSYVSILPGVSATCHEVPFELQAANLSLMVLENILYFFNMDLDNNISHANTTCFPKSSCRKWPAFEHIIDE